MPKIKVEKAPKASSRHLSFDDQMKSLSPEEQMKRKLETDDKVMFMIPLDRGDAIGTKLPINLNGYKIEYPKGRMIEIPSTIANLLAEKYTMQMDSGLKARADRDTKTRDALS
jgi:hypothetical protein